MQLNCLPLDEDRFKGLDAQAVKGRGSVQHDGMFPDDFVEDIPYLRPFLFHDLFGGLDGNGQPLLPELPVDKGLKELQRHPFGKAALMELQFWSHDDHGTPGIVDPFPKEILPESTLFPAEHVA